MLIVIFGLSGSGKNFVSHILANHFGFYFYDADQLLPQTVLNAIQNKQLFTQSMRDDLTLLIIKKITDLKKKHPNLVIAQGLYKNKNRTELLSALPDAKLIWVEATPENISARLISRRDDVDEPYANKLSTNFEKPTHPYVSVKNNADESSIILQLLELFPLNKSK
ncbi:MAG: shikimate kinase [Gammaproteobacteria bacterium]|nr:shikimate kinase [Gammaproteobacteria bacterium]